MKVILENVQISFAKTIFEPKPNDKGKLQYSAAFVFAEDSKAHKLVAKAIDTVGKETFGDNWPTIKKMKTVDNRAILHVGDNSKYTEYAGKMYLNSYSPKRPNVVDEELHGLTLEDGKINSGCFVNASIDISAWVKDKAPMLSATLLGVQYVGPGEEWGVTAAPSGGADDFKKLVDNEL